MFKALLVGAMLVNCLLASVSVMAEEASLMQCTGYDSRTDAFVTGTCNGSLFTGYDSQTGAFINGTCTGMSFSGYDSQTEAYVYGTCS